MNTCINLRYEKTFFFYLTKLWKKKKKIEKLNDMTNKIRMKKKTFIYLCELFG